MRIDPVRLNHMNLVVEDFDAGVAHFTELYGAELATDLPSPAFHACVLAFGGGLFELFAPNAWLLSARYGPFHLGVEYCADMDETREVLASGGVRLIRDIGVAVHTHPQDTMGVSFEFTGMNFENKVWKTLQRQASPQSFWRDEHPLGLSRLKGYSIAVADLDASLRQMTDLFAIEIVAEEARPALAARAVVVRLADSLVELLAPDGNGELEHYLARAGQGVRSTLFAARDLEVAWDGFASRGIPVQKGPIEGRFIVPATHNAGAMFEIEAED